MAKILNSQSSQNLITEQQSGSSGRWLWKDDSNTLEFLSNNPAADRQDKRRERRQKGVNATQDKAKRNERAVSSRKVNIPSKQNQTQKSRSKQSAHNYVTLADVKSVAWDKIDEVEKIADGFQHMFCNDKFDEFLCYLLNYFNRFYEKKLHDSKPNPMNIEPSVADLEYQANLTIQLQAAQKRMGQSYSTLVLGIDMEHNHHMACGKSRVSNTAKDKYMYETLYSFCSFAVWITFRRKDYECVRQEIGRMLRSDTFNPSLRVKPTSESENGDDEKDDNRSLKSADGIRREREKRPSEAEYRRMQGKRPAIKSIINQRSPALVAILPSPKEEAHWLFKKSTMPKSAKSDSSDIQLSVQNLKVGIIGEPYDQFNPQTLTPIGAENEEEEGEEGAEKVRRESTMLSSTHPKTPQSQTDVGMSRQATAISTATTEALSDED